MSQTQNDGKMDSHASIQHTVRMRLDRACHRYGNIKYVNRHAQEINLSKCLSVHHKSHMNWPEIELMALQ